MKRPEELVYRTCYNLRLSDEVAPLCLLSGFDGNDRKIAPASYKTEYCTHTAEGCVLCAKFPVVPGKNR